MVDGEDGNARLPHRPRDRVVRGRIVEILYVEIDLAADCVGRVVHRGPGVATIVVEDQIDRQAAGPAGGNPPEPPAPGSRGPPRHPPAPRASWGHDWATPPAPAPREPPP